MKLKYNFIFCLTFMSLLAKIPRWRLKLPHQIKHKCKPISIKILLLILLYHCISFAAMTHTLMKVKLLLVIYLSHGKMYHQNLYCTKIYFN